MASTTLKVSITGDASGLQKAARSAETSVSSMSAKIDKAQGSFKSGFVGSGTSAEEWGKRVHLASGVAAAGAAYFAKKAGDMASDVAEAQNKVGVVFEGSADEVVKFAQTSAKAYGISKAAALDYTGTLGNLLVSSGLSSKAAADMSVSMVKLAADLGSFNNVPVDDALEAIRSGLVGESEPLKRFGVNLNEATLKAKAMQLGLSDGKGTLDANAKAQAAYAIILAQTGTAQNDFANTSSGLANSQKIASATAQDAAASMGTSFLPVYKEAVRVVSAGVQVFDKLPSSLKTGTVAFAALGGSALFLAPKVLAGAQALGTAAQAVKTFGSAGGGLDTIRLKAMAAGDSLKNIGAGGAIAVGSLTAIVGAAAFGIQTWAKANADAARAAKTLSDAIIADSGAIGENTRQVLLNQLAKRGNTKELAEAGVSFTQLTAAVGKTGQAYTSYKDIVIGASRNVDGTISALQKEGGVRNNLIATILKHNGYNKDSIQLIHYLTDEYKNADAGQSDYTDQIKIGTAATAGSVVVDKQKVAALKTAQAAVAAGTATEQQAHIVNKARLQDSLDHIAKNAALTASLHDLTESVKAYKENEADAAGQGPRSAAIRQQAAEQAVANAESIRQAEQAQVDAERGLQSSIRGVADAEHARAEAGRAVVAAQRGVEAAERGVADAVRNQQAAVRAVGEAEHSRLEALRSVESAERSLQSAERASAASVRDLTQARKDAAYQLASAALGARGDALSVQAAQFALADAQAAAAKGPGTDNTDPNAQGKLNLAVAQAQLQLEQASQSATKAQEDLTDAQKKGVEGSDRVVSAQQAIEDSANAVADAHHGVTEAQRGVTAADQALVDAHRGVDQANQGVIDSIITLEGAHHDLGEALRGVAAADQGIRDAHYEVAKAQQAVADAAKATSEAVQKASDDQQIAQFEIALVMNDAKKNSGALKDAIEKDMAAAATAATNLALPLVIIDALLSHITGGTPVDLSGFQAVTTASSYGSSGGGGGGTLNQRKGPRNKGDETTGLGKPSTPTATPASVEITRYDPSKLGPQIATSGKYKGIDLNPASHFGAPTGDLSYTSPADQAVIDMKAAMDAFLAQMAAQSSQPLQVTVTSTLDGTVVAQSTGKALATTAVSQGGRRPH